MTPTRTRLAAAALGVGLVIAAPAAAWAGPRRPVSSAGSESSTERIRPRNNDIEAVRARCLAAIDTRLPRLDAARTAVTNHRHLSDEHEAALVAEIDVTAARLRALVEPIKSSADLATLRQHCRSIFEDNRVFALVLPRARLVVGADTAGAAAAKLTDVAAKLADAIDRAEAANQDVTQARQDLAAMEAAIASGAATAAGIPGSVLGLTPADWNADHQILTPARQALRDVRSDLKEARELARKIRRELKPTRSPAA